MFPNTLKPNTRPCFQSFTYMLFTAEVGYSQFMKAKLNPEMGSDSEDEFIDKSLPRNKLGDFLVDFKKFLICLDKLHQRGIFHLNLTPKCFIQYKSRVGILDFKNCVIDPKTLEDLCLTRNKLVDQSKSLRKTYITDQTIKETEFNNTAEQIDGYILCQQSEAYQAGNLLYFFLTGEPLSKNR